jgi:hypothetical protein
MVEVWLDAKGVNWSKCRLPQGRSGWSSQTQRAPWQVPQIIGPH